MENEIYHEDGTVSFSMMMDDDLFLAVAKEAHRRDITINKMVEICLAEFLNDQSLIPTLTDVAK